MANPNDPALELQKNELSLKIDGIKAQLAANPDDEDLKQQLKDAEAEMKQLQQQRKAAREQNRASQPRGKSAEARAKAHGQQKKGT